MCQGGLNYTQVLFIQFDVLGKSVSALNGCKNDLYFFNGNNLMVIKEKMLPDFTAFITHW